MNLFLKSLPPILLGLGLSSLSRAEDPSVSGWTYLNDSQGVQVWSKEFPNSPVIAVRGTVKLPFPIAEVYTVLTDNSRCTEWLPMITKKETLQQISTNTRIEYAQIKMPWPLQDRYTVAEGSLEVRSGNTYWISYKSVDGHLSDPERVRARLDLSTFYLRPEGAEATYIDVILLSDPMGSVPKFLVNRFQRSWPVQFLDGLKRQIAKLRDEKANPPTISAPTAVAH